MVALFVLMRVDYRKYNNPKIIFPLMAVTGAAAARRVRMQRHERRASLDHWPASLQPSELAKPVIVLFLAWFLQTRIHAIDDCEGNDAARGVAAAGVHRA